MPNNIYELGEDQLKRLETIARLEPRSRTSEEAGIQACIADPLWMLARQWQNGEFTAENAGSPISVAVEYATYALNRVILGTNTSIGDFSNTPLEKLVEQEGAISNWRKPVQAGQLFEASIRKFHQKTPLENGVDDAINFFRTVFKVSPPVGSPGDNLDQETKRFLQFVENKVTNGASVLLWAKINYPDLDKLKKINGKDIVGISPVQLKEVLSKFIPECARLNIGQGLGFPSAWQNESLQYQFKIGGIGKNGQTEIGDKYLSAPDYQNGDLDWYHFNAAEAIKNANWITQPPFKSLPTHLRLRGTSLRWWEFEDAKLDFPHSDTANQTDLAKSLVVGYELFYSDDWYTLSLPVELSNLLKINSMKVVNVFGDEADIYPAQVLHHDPLMRWEVFGMSPITDGFAQTDSELRSVHGFDEDRYNQLLIDRENILHDINDPKTTTPARMQLYQKLNSITQSLNELLKHHHSILFIPPAAGFREESAPLEEIRFLRDEGANLVWAVEQTLLNDMGNPISGFDWHRDYDGRAKAQKTAQLRSDIAQLQTQLQRPVLTTVLRTELTKKLSAAQKQLTELENTASPPEVPQYRLKTEVPGNWIPFLPVRQKDGASMELRKGAVQDENNAHSHLLRYLTAVEESSIPRSGRRLMLTAQRLRWTDGSTYIWIGRKVAVGKGEGSSGLRFDVLK